MYNKLFSKIVDSSIWLESDATRIVWVMFIAVMNEDGFVEIASPANVAHKARITEEEALEALKVLESPDTRSASQDNEGRRIERVQGGWMVLNAPLYRSIVTRQVAREQTRLRVQNFRQRKRADVTQSNGTVTPSEAEADTNTNVLVGSTSKKSPKKATISDEEWMKQLRGSEAYKGIDIDREHAKMVQWCEVKKRPATRRRFVAWLNRVEVPMAPVRRNQGPPARLRDIPPEFPQWFIEHHEGRRDELGKWTSWEKIPFLLQQDYLKWRAKRSASPS